MQLKIDAGVQKEIARYTDENSRILFLYEDGVSPYSHVGEIAMMISMVIVIVNKDQPYLEWFDDTIETSMGLWPVKGYSKAYLDNDMELYIKPFGDIALKSESSVIDDTVVIRDERKTSVAAK